MSQSVVLEVPQAASLQRSHSLSTVERCALALGVFEIPLQLDKYFFFRKEDSMLGALGGFNVSLTTISLILLYAVWAGNLLVTKGVHRSLAGGRGRLGFVLGVPMLAYLAANFISVWIAPVRILSMFDCFLLMQAYLLFIYVANRIVNETDLSFLLLVITASVLLQSASVLGLKLFGAPGLEYHLGPLNLSVRVDGRPEGTLRSPNGAGSVLYILGMTSACLAFGRPKFRTWLSRLTIVAFVLAIIATETRGAISALLLGGGFVGAVAAWRKWLPAKLAIVGILGAILSIVPATTLLTKRYLQSDGESAASRVHLSQIAFDAIQLHPLLGSGAGNCHIVTEPFAVEAGMRSEWFYTTHCKYLLVWVETGLLGLAAFLAMLATGVICCLMTLRLQNRFSQLVALTTFAALGGHMLHLFVDIFNSRVQVQCLWLTLGIAVAAFRLGLDDTSSRLQHSKRDHSEMLK
ncbi:MAG TPA: hypothetical protein DDW52_14365 [Planctomycetaceae bacterium]|nr:hypothetical protein [Planctomycetaceae bacterium]